MQGNEDELISAKKSGRFSMEKRAQLKPGLEPSGQPDAFSIIRFTEQGVAFRQELLSNSLIDSSLSLA